MPPSTGRSPGRRDFGTLHAGAAPCRVEGTGSAVLLKHPQVQAGPGRPVHHFLPGSNWDASFVNAGNLIWLGAVLLLADGVISALGLRVPKPLRRSKLRARKPGEWSRPEPAPVIIGIDG